VLSAANRYESPCIVCRLDYGRSLRNPAGREVDSWLARICEDSNRGNGPQAVGSRPKPGADWLRGSGACNSVDLYARLPNLIRSILINCSDDYLSPGRFVFLTETVPQSALQSPSNGIRERCYQGTGAGPCPGIRGNGSDSSGTSDGRRRTPARESSNPTEDSGWAPSGAQPKSKAGFGEGSSGLRCPALGGVSPVVHANLDRKYRVGLNEWRSHWRRLLPESGPTPMRLATASAALSDPCSGRVASRASLSSRTGVR
jgi:hypothetical protein